MIVAFIQKIMSLVLIVGVLMTNASGVVLAQGAATGAAPVQAGQQPQDTVVEGRVLEVVSETTQQYSESQQTVQQELRVEILTGELSGETVTILANRLLSVNTPAYKVGDEVLVNVGEDVTGQQYFYIVDYVRRPALLGLFLVFVVTVMGVAGWHGLRSILGLFSSFAIIFAFVLPQIQRGVNPVLVAIIGGLMIAVVTFYLSHGLQEKTTLAIFGTLGALVVAGILAEVFANLAMLTGFAAEETIFLQTLKGSEFNIRGLMLAGILLGALGVLDDITISQASVVKELKDANPKMSRWELYRRAMNVGRDHIASLVNTLILVYAGSSLPLLLLFQMDESRSFGTVINYEIVAEEVVRTLVGSVALVVAVPITTVLACFYGFSKKKKGS